MARNVITVVERTALEKQLWGLAIAQGVLAILFGVLALFWPDLTVTLLIVFFGIFVLIWGVVGIISSLSTIESNKFWWIELAFAVLALGLAVFVLRNPTEAAKIFVFFIGITFLVRGVVDLVEGLFDRVITSGNRLFHVIVGVIGVLAGIITLSYPVSAGLAVLWIIGLYAVLYGSVLIAFAFRSQNELLPR